MAFGNRVSLPWRDLQPFLFQNNKPGAREADAPRKRQRIARASTPPSLAMASLLTDIRAAVCVM